MLLMKPVANHSAAAAQADLAGQFGHLVPDFIYQNLKQGMGRRPYQQEVFGRFIYRWDSFKKTIARQPLQLLCHMATGSGKTVVMAGLIIYLYRQGYRNFLFFVNSTNIIDKTRDNFLNKYAAKYLFAPSIYIDEKPVHVKEAANFQNNYNDDINIVFLTIQGLHASLNNPSENSLTYNDFEDKRIVLISDEAHHINAETKKSTGLPAGEKENIISWEGTVNRIVHNNPENILLEFTATIDLSIPAIQKKYSDKILFDYPLKQFRKDGYSKEVKVLQSDLPLFDRALQSVLLSQYRRKLFEKYGKPVKPVILFKSKTIKDSLLFYEIFATGIKQLQAAGIEKIKAASHCKALEKLFEYLEDNNISVEDFVTDLKEDFSEEKLILVNSKDESEQKQIAVNSLENEKNKYRAVFAVDKLNEGWDVLNLFDIVRLYNTRDGSNKKPGKTTMAEAQLIGRGARYFPFQITDGQPLFQRKYDEDVYNELRLCEELYYHSAYNPLYIQELNTALQDIGMKPAAEDKKDVEVKITHFSKPTTSDTGLQLAPQLIFKVMLSTGFSKSVNIFEHSQIEKSEMHERAYELSTVEPHIIRKALSKIAFYQFANLKKLLPGITSVSDFISSDKYLAKIKVIVITHQLINEKFSAGQKLDISMDVLNQATAVFNQT